MINCPPHWGVVATNLPDNQQGVTVYGYSLASLMN